MKFYITSTYVGGSHIEGRWMVSAVMTVPADDQINCNHGHHTFYLTLEETETMIAKLQSAKAWAERQRDES